MKLISRELENQWDHEIIIIIIFFIKKTRKKVNLIIDYGLQAASGAGMSCVITYTPSTAEQVPHFCSYSILEIILFDI